MKIFSITYKGNIDKKITVDELNQTIEKIFKIFNKNVTHYAISLPNKNTGKIKKYRKDKRLLESIQNNQLEYISFFALPQNYITAAFDYSLYITINYKRKHLALFIEENLIENKKIELVKEICRSYMVYPCIEEIFTMDKEETPLLYVEEINPMSSFKTLKIISKEIISLIHNEKEVS